MTAFDVERFASCPSWCAGHDDAQESRPPRWHRSAGEVFPVVERRRAMLGGGGPAPLVATDCVAALERDADVEYVFVGVLEDMSRFVALTVDSARLLHATLGRLLHESER